MKKKSVQISTLLLAIISMMAGTAFSQKRFEIKGTATAMNGYRVQLVRDYYGNPNVMASDSVVNGKFKLSAPVDEILPAYVVFRAGRDGSSFSVIVEPATALFTLEPNGRKAVSGGKYNKLLFGYETQPAFIKADNTMRENAKKGLDNIKDQEEQYEAMQVFLRRNELREKYLVNVMNTSREERVKVMAAILLELQPDRIKANEIVDKAASTLGEKSVLIQIARRMNKDQEFQISSRRGKMDGKPYIDFTAASLAGDSVQLSTLLNGNKYTLVQFWASWCVPCRHEIPLLKQLYTANRGKGFNIVAFSLDENKFAWTKASEKEDFAWTNISDLKGFNSQIVKQYQLSGIPANVIIDQQGKIIASNLVGEDLEKKISELMK
ncbi:MAG: AhpC/TSA family protein [Chitinophagaceae bacterium]|nr:AhpC/TSA family protein [Chitinophagaceae bacterium]